MAEEIAVTYYSTDEDLKKHQANILTLGQESWDDYHLESFALINRDLDVSWYRQANDAWTTTPFDPDLLLTPSQFTRLSCFKVLELAFAFLSSDSEDKFVKLSNQFNAKYADELEMVMKSGIDYDMDESGVIESGEVKQITSVSLVRC